MGSLGAANDDVDRKGEPVTVYDVVFHPQTLEDSDTQFVQFIVELTMMRVEEKYPERPKINPKRAFKKLRQREWKGREIEEQSIRSDPQVKVVDEGSGLREFSTPEAAEPMWEVQHTKRRRDGREVVRLRVELPGVRPEELTVSISEQFVSVIAMHIGEMKYKAECACQRPEGHVLLSKCLHLANYTLTLVWGPPEAIFLYLNFFEDSLFFFFSAEY